MLNGVYEVLVVTDITNYFDSIQHDLLVEYLSPLRLPRKAMGLLGRLLEAFKPCAGHSPNPRVGLAVDEVDCSRELAHLFLFEHDQIVANKFGEENYVRWMDDQNIGVRSLTEARKAVNILTRSLSSQRLTLNSAKTKFLTLPQVTEHFQLEANAKLASWEESFKVLTLANLPEARASLIETWNEISTSDYVGVGNWVKILKRVYSLATKVNLDILETLATNHLVEYPELDEKIFLYFARRNRAQQLVSLFEGYCQSGENLFEGTESVFFESLLLLNPPPGLTPIIRSLSSRFARSVAEGQSGKPLARCSALVALYWFGESGTVLANLFDSEAGRRLPKEVARAWLATVSALTPSLLKDVQARLVGHPADDVARLSDFLTRLISGTVASLGSYKHQKSRWPLSGKYYDARSWLALHIASSTDHKGLRASLRKDFEAFRKVARTAPEKRIAARIDGRLAD
jgi:hypothetical protein